MRIGASISWAEARNMLRLGIAKEVGYCSRFTNVFVYKNNTIYEASEDQPRYPTCLEGRFKVTK